MAIGPAAMTLFIVFGGLYVNSNNVPAFLRWLPKVRSGRGGDRRLVLASLGYQATQGRVPLATKHCKSQARFRELLGARHNVKHNTGWLPAVDVTHGHSSSLTCTSCCVAYSIAGLPHQARI
jgi:hypothetical protein